MQNIYLVGFMGTGKTTVGKLVADKLGVKFVEMDAVIEEQEGIKIVDIFAQKGEPYFRGLEKELLKELSVQHDLVVSCGGGLVCDDQNLKLLKSTGIVFSLEISAEVAYERTKKCACRPILNVSDPLTKIKELLAARNPYYSQAHYTINTEENSIEESADKIANIVNNG